MGALTVTVSRPVADDEDERLRLAGSTGTPPHVLARLATDAGTDSTTIRTAVAQNPNTPRATLTVLASDTRPLTRVRVAANRNTPTSVLRQLAEDSNIHVRIVIARNPNTPAGILDALSRSDDLDIASSVAGHANASAATIERLSHHDDIAIRPSPSATRGSADAGSGSLNTNRTPSSPNWPSEHWCAGPCPTSRRRSPSSLTSSCRHGRAPPRSSSSPPARSAGHAPASRSRTRPGRPPRQADHPPPRHPRTCVR